MQGILVVMAKWWHNLKFALVRCKVTTLFNIIMPIDSIKREKKNKMCAKVNDHNIITKLHYKMLESI